MNPESASGGERRVNRLAGEKSPYLLQHRHNPVNWHPWGAEAFAEAQRHGRPIFLSIGYSTCHWCHVMERESFENEAVAEFLNAHFVSIKVDREERPDVDHLYMRFVQATTGQGGWPLSVFLTPERQPFFGGTYFPPEGQYGRPGFLDLLEHIRLLWEERRPEVVSGAVRIQQRVKEAAEARDAPPVPLSPILLEGASRRFQAEYDPAEGGFGTAPKFPQPGILGFLLRRGARASDQAAVEMVLHTCDRMAAGGIHDQLGGGFARYSVDGSWHVPHFEKMLYDNAQLAGVYLDAWLLSGQPRDAEVARDILDYVLRDLTHPDGGFYSAEDADSEGQEGKFYCWTLADMAALLAPEELEAAARHYGVTPEGNFADHSHPEPLPGLNVLRLAVPAPGPAERDLVRSATVKLQAARGRRVRPHLDDKVLVSWNGLMLGALARGYAALGDERYLAAARRNLAFLQDRLWDARTATLHHRWREGERDGVQLLAGHAFLLAGVLDLYEATLDPADLEFALALAGALLDQFYDAGQGGFWQSPWGATDLIDRLKDDHDGAEPSGNAVATFALLRLAAITGRQEFRQAAEKTLTGFAGRLRSQPQAWPCLLAALDFFLGEPARVVIAGPAGPGTAALARAAHAVYHPGRVVLGTRGPVEPFAAGLPERDGHPTAYVCIGASCQSPTHDPAQLQEQLRASLGPTRPPDA